MYSRWRHPSKTVSTRPYCRSRRGRNVLGSEANSDSEFDSISSSLRVTHGEIESDLDILITATVTTTAKLLLIT